MVCLLLLSFLTFLCIFALGGALADTLLSYSLRGGGRSSVSHHVPQFAGEFDTWDAAAHSRSPARPTSDRVSRAIACFFRLPQRRHSGLSVALDGSLSVQGHTPGFLKVRRCVRALQELLRYFGTSPFPAFVRQCRTHLGQRGQAQGPRQTGEIGLTPDSTTPPPAMSRTKNSRWSLNQSRGSSWLDVEEVLDNWWSFADCFFSKTSFECRSTCRKCQ